MVSIKDIANKAKVSIGTVDRVLHNRGRVADETKARVERIVQALGYRPNIHARNLSLDRGYTFGIVIPRLSQDSEYWKIPMKGIQRAGHELQMYKVNLSMHHFDRYSDRSFERALTDALKKVPDGLLIAPVLPRPAQDLVPRIPKQTPYVFIDSTIPRSSCLSFIGQDPFQSGFLAARLMLRSINKGEAIAVVRVLPEDFHIAERIRGFLDALRGGHLETPRVYDADSHRGENAFSDLVELMVRENKRLGGVFVSNAWTHSIARRIHTRSGCEKVTLVGYDLVGKNVRSLQENAIDFLISQRPEMQGYEGIYCLFEHIVLRETVKRRIMVPIDIITRDNVQYFQD